jgi:hypothetical protein
MTLVYRCDCPVAYENTIVECGSIARYVWKVRMRDSGREGLIARCVLPGHADTVKRFLRHPERTYDLVEAIRPLEFPL